MHKRSTHLFVVFVLLTLFPFGALAQDTNPVPGITVTTPTTASTPAADSTASTPTTDQKTDEQKKDEDKKDGVYECLNTYPLYDPNGLEAIQEKALDSASGGKRNCYELRTKGIAKGDSHDLDNITPTDKDALDKQIEKDIQNLNSGNNVTCSNGTCVDNNTRQPTLAELSDPNNPISPLNPNNPLNPINLATQNLPSLIQQTFGNSLTDGVFSEGIQSGFGMNGYQLDGYTPNSYATDPRPAIPLPNADERAVLIKMAYAEKCSSGLNESCKAFIETVRNRVICGQQGTKQCPSTYTEALRWACQGGYYDCYNGNIARYNSITPTSKPETWKTLDGYVDEVMGLTEKPPTNITNGATQNWSGSYSDMINRYDGRPDSVMKIGGEYYYSKTYESRVDISEFKGGYDQGPYNPMSYSNLGQNPPSQYASNQSQTSPNRTLNFPSTGIAQVDRTLNTFLRTAAGFSGANIQNPLGMMGMFGNSAGGSLASGMFSGLLQSLLGNSAPRTGTTGSNPFASNQSSAGLSGLVGNLANNLNPFSSILGSNPLTNGQNLLNQPNAQTALNNLLTQQSRTLQQFANQSPTNTNDYIRQLEQLQRQNLEQLRQFSYQYPDANQTYLREQQRIIEDSLTQLERYAATTLPTQFGGDAQNIINEYLGQQASLTVNPNGTSGGSQTNTAIASDLTVTALRANKTLTNEYRFRGSLSRILLNANDNIAFSEVGSYFGSNVAHELLLDLSCDGTVDEKLRFNTPYYSILPRSDGADVLLSEYLEVPEDGLHCFAFAVDVDNLIPELNENNNQSAWREFIASVGTPGSAIPDLPPLNFEISVYADGYDTLVQDWTDADVTIVAGQQVAFRWDAPEYQECVPLLSSLTPDVAANTSPVERNTLSEKVELHEHNGYYELRCSVDGATRIETIHITVEEESEEDDS